MKVLRWTPEALDDVDRIAEFNRQRSTAWATKVERRIVARSRTLPSLPRQGRATAIPGLRLLSIPDIQYVLTYRVEDDAIWIVRVHHTREKRESS